MITIMMKITLMMMMGPSTEIAHAKVSLFLTNKKIILNKIRLRKLVKAVHAN